jgi:hypothetical protein
MSYKESYMTTEIETVEKRTNPYAKQLVVTGIIVAILILLVYFIPSLHAFRVHMTFLLLIYLIYSIGLAAIMYRIAPSPLPIMPFVIGLIIAAGGAALDGISTVINTPTLVLEINPVARSLVDSGYSLNFVMIYGIVFQVAFVVFVCVLWAAFLKHKETYIALVSNNSEKSYLGFIKAAMGGAHLSWRQFFLPLKIDELPTTYYFVWILPICFIWASLLRWYLGFNRLGLVSFPLSLVLIISIAVPIIGYLIWLWLEYKKA